MSHRHFSAKQANPAGADDGETDALGIFFHQRRTR
jgi:hypothetical protein